MRTASCSFGVWTASAKFDGCIRWLRPFPRGCGPLTPPPPSTCRQLSPSSRSTVPVCLASSRTRAINWDLLTSKLCVSQSVQDFCLPAAPSPRESLLFQTTTAWAVCGRSRMFPLHTSPLTVPGSCSCVIASLGRCACAHCAPAATSPPCLPRTRSGKILGGWLGAPKLDLCYWAGSEATQLLSSRSVSTKLSTCERTFETEAVRASSPDTRGHKVISPPVPLHCLHKGFYLFYSFKIGLGPEDPPGNFVA